MKKISLWVVSIAVLFSFIFSTTADAAVSVKGYYRKDGTYVAPHYRSTPDGIATNNWSYPGNTNPYTGETATGNPNTYLQNYYGGSSSGIPSVAVPSFSPTATPQLTQPQPTPVMQAVMSDAERQSFIEELKHQIIVLQLQLQVVLLQNQLASLL